jgi:DNA-binding SARP family transcriptional activator
MKRLRAKVLAAAGRLAMGQGDYVHAQALHEEALTLRRALGDQAAVAGSLNNLGNVLGYLGKYDHSQSMHEESLALRQGLGDLRGAAQSLQNLGWIALRQGAYSRAEAVYAESLTQFRLVGDKRSIALGLNNQGLALKNLGEYARAAEAFGESLTLFKELGDPWGSSLAQQNLATMACEEGDYARAVTLNSESLEIKLKISDRAGIAVCLDLFAQVLLEQSRAAPAPRQAEHHRQASRLFGAAALLRERIRTPLPPLFRSRYDQDVMRARSMMGEEAFAKAWAEGRALTMEQAIELALGVKPAIDLPPPAAPRPFPAVVDGSPSASFPKLRIFALGRARVLRGVQLLTTADWTYSRARELLFYLLSNEPRTKEQIGLDLMPDASPAQLRSNIKVTLHHLRRALGGREWIIFENDRYGFNRSLRYWFDVEEFESHLAQAHPHQTQDSAQAIHFLEEAAKLYRGDFMEDLTVGDWYLVRREELRRMLLDGLLTLGRLLFASRQYAEAAEVYRKAIARDNYLEVAHRELMRCYARQGELTQAVRHYRMLVELMRDELGSPPARETTALFERLRLGKEA